MHVLDVAQPIVDQAEFLVAQRHDESEGVRITVVHALGRMPPAEGWPVLQEMTRDPSPRVSDEARRYLTLLRPPAEARELKR